MILMHVESLFSLQQLQVTDFRAMSKPVNMGSAAAGLVFTVRS